MWAPSQSRTRQRSHCGSGVVAAVAVGGLGAFRNLGFDPANAYEHKGQREASARALFEGRSSVVKQFQCLRPSGQSEIMNEGD